MACRFQKWTGLKKCGVEKDVGGPPRTSWDQTRGVRDGAQFPVDFVLVDMWHELIEELVGTFEFDDVICSQQGRQTYLPVVVTALDLAFGLGREGDAIEVQAGTDLGDHQQSPVAGTGRVLGRPDWQLGVMIQEQIGQKVGVLGVILGAAGEEGDGVDGMVRDPVVGLQEGHELDAGLFQAPGPRGPLGLLSQFREPFAKGFGRGSDDDGPALAGAGVEEAKIGPFCRNGSGRRRGHKDARCS